MSDPLEKVENPRLREQLGSLRDLDGSVESSSKLRETLPGFKGQKGIYKPRGSPYALWVRQTLRRAYPDKELIVEPDGSWVYDYAPEGRKGQPDMSLDTNRALLRCMKDGIPVGVIRQVETGSEGRRYEIRGLGYVTGFDGAHFRIRGEPIDIASRPVETPTSFEFEPFDRTFPALSQTLRKIRDTRFRLAVRRVYHERCGLCNLGYRIGKNVLAVDAAHVIPVQNEGTSKDVRNGILLCNNHHTLFDSYAWTIDEDLRVQVTLDPEFRRSAASNHVLVAEGRRLENLPDLMEDHPGSAAIRYRLEMFDRHQ